jgi:hypothetical protein
VIPPTLEAVENAPPVPVACWRIKDVSTYDPQVYGPTHFHHGIPKVLVNLRSKGITSVWSTSTH